MNIRAIFLLPFLCAFAAGPAIAQSQTGAPSFDDAGNWMCESLSHPFDFAAAAKSFPGGPLSTPSTQNGHFWRTSNTFFDVYYDQQAFFSLLIQPKPRIWTVDTMPAQIAWLQSFGPVSEINYAYTVTGGEKRDLGAGMTAFPLAISLSGNAIQITWLQPDDLAQIKPLCAHHTQSRTRIPAGEDLAAAASVDARAMGEIAAGDLEDALADELAAYRTQTGLPGAQFSGQYTLDRIVWISSEIFLEHADIPPPALDQYVALAETGKDDEEARKAFDTKDYARAETIWKAIYELRLHVLGAQDHSTVDAQENMGAAVYLEGRKDEGRRIIEQALSARAQALAASHPDIAAKYVSGMMDRATASPGYVKSLPETRTGPQRRAVLIGKAEQAALDARIPSDISTRLANAGGAAAKEDLVRSLCETYSKVLGPGHLAAIDCRQQLAAFLSSNGRGDEALQMKRAAYDLETRSLGWGSTYTASAAQDIGQTLFDSGKFTDAEPYWIQAVQMWRLQLSAGDYWTTLSAQAMLGRDRLKLGRYADAYTDLKIAADGTWSYIHDIVRVPLDSQYHDILNRSRATFTGQIEAAWGWSHMP